MINPDRLGDYTVANGISSMHESITHKKSLRNSETFLLLLYGGYTSGRY
jgi:hypothetical protein